MRDPRDEPTSFNPVEYADEQRRGRLDREYWENYRACFWCGLDAVTCACEENDPAPGA